MPNENILKFSEIVASSPELAAKIQAIQSNAARNAAEQIARLSAEAGVPFSAEEFLEQASLGPELSDEQLEAVSGGAWAPSGGNIAMSILSVGFGCFVAAAVSNNTKGSADKCQF